MGWAKEGEPLEKKFSDSTLMVDLGTDEPHIRLSLGIILHNLVQAVSTLSR